MSTSVEYKLRMPQRLCQSGHLLTFFFPFKLSQEHSRKNTAKIILKGLNFSLTASLSGTYILSLT